MPAVSIKLHLPLYPRHKQIDDPALLILRQLSAFRYAIPFAEAASAAAGTCVLGLEYGMSSHGSLPAVIGYYGGRQPPGDKILGMASYGLHTLFFYIRSILCIKMKACAKG